MSVEARNGLLDKFRKGDLRALSRMISLAENKDAAILALMQELYPQAGRALVIGLTGTPGAGKSSLTNAFVRFLREEKKTVGVIAVDPVSPFSGGALLGDRIRLSDHFNDPGVFIRSLSTRGKLGGLSLATREVVQIADCFGLDCIILETVGVGQSEVDVRKIADVTLVVLTPEWGDSVQAIKAGLLEIGDIYVVNKADREGADRLVSELRNMLDMGARGENPVLSTSILQEPTVRALFSEVMRFVGAHRELIAKRRGDRGKETVSELLEDLVATEARRWVEENVAATGNPYQFIQEFLLARPAGSFFRR